MAWLWWLSAPVLITSLGAVALSWHERRSDLTSQRDPMAAHEALLDALSNVIIASAQGSPNPER